MRSGLGLPRRRSNWASTVRSKTSTAWPRGVVVGIRNVIFFGMSRSSCPAGRGSTCARRRGGGRRRPFSTRSGVSDTRERAQNGRGLRVLGVVVREGADPGLGDVRPAAGGVEDGRGGVVVGRPKVGAG